ncbi:hypothetical protein Tcan_00698, partial [Toxocara canis]
MFDLERPSPRQTVTTPNREHRGPVGPVEPNRGDHKQERQTHTRRRPRCLNVQSRRRTYYSSSSQSHTRCTSKKGGVVYPCTLPLICTYLRFACTSSLTYFTVAMFRHNLAGSTSLACFSRPHLFGPLYHPTYHIRSLLAI